ncbi:MAG: hypothetical protein IJU44_11910 [Kiritimatiellae bacterium]|nr:hypothetical protein [Kiritimatiellia bacterium]
MRTAKLVSLGHGTFIGSRLGLLAVSGLLSLKLFAAWDPGEPVTTYWAGPGYPGNCALTETWLAQMKDGGFNTVWATTPEELDIAAKYGMRVIYRPWGSLHGKLSQIDDAEVAKVVGELVDRVKNHPALYVYSLFDEPPAEKFAELAHIKEWIGRRDPNHAVWVNLLPTYANNKQLGVEGEIIRAYWEHVRLFGEVFRPEFITYDHYQLQNGGDSPNYLLNLGIIRQSASAQGVPFWNGVQACTWRPGAAASPSAPRIPGPDEMRYLVYTTAAYGARGIYYYVYCRQGHSGSIVSLEGEPDAKFEVLKTLNREFVAIAKELAPMRFVGAYLQGAHAPGSTPWCEQALLKITPEAPITELQPGKELTDTVMVSRFEKSGASTHLMVVNMDYRNERSLKVTSPTETERFNPLTREWTPVGKTFNLELNRGTGVLLRLK